MIIVTETEKFDKDLFDNASLYIKNGMTLKNNNNIKSHFFEPEIIENEDEIIIKIKKDKHHEL
jgi:hypothetical protein